MPTQFTTERRIFSRLCYFWTLSVLGVALFSGVPELRGDDPFGRPPAADVDIFTGKPVIPTPPEQLRAMKHFENVLKAYEFDEQRWVTRVDFSRDDRSWSKSPREVSDFDLVALQAFPRLVRIELTGCKITDQALVNLDKLKTLTALGLAGTLVTDRGLQHLAKLRNLEGLDLSETRITENGLKHLASLTKLRVLDLSGNFICEEGFRHLEPLQELRVLHLQNHDYRYSEFYYMTEASLPLLMSFRNLKELRIRSPNFLGTHKDELLRSLPNCKIN